MSAYSVESRIGYAIVDGKVVFEPKGSSMDTRTWMREVLKLPEDQIENTIRGGIYTDKITICMGADYRKVDASTITLEQFMCVLNRHHDEYGTKSISLDNGCIVGNAGENWDALEYMGILSFNPGD